MGEQIIVVILARALRGPLFIFFMLPPPARQPPVRPPPPPPPSPPPPPPLVPPPCGGPVVTSLSTAAGHGAIPWYKKCRNQCPGEETRHRATAELDLLLRHLQRLARTSAVISRGFIGGSRCLRMHSCPVILTLESGSWGLAPRSRSPRGWPERRLIGASSGRGAPRGLVTQSPRQK
jgi:hypothetical protein